MAAIGVSWSGRYQFCGGDTRPKRVKRSHWFQQKLYIVEDVEAEVCTECGERYFHATTLDKIDALLKRQLPYPSHLMGFVILC